MIGSVCRNINLKSVIRGGLLLLFQRGRIRKELEARFFARTG